MTGSVGACADENLGEVSIVIYEMVLYTHVKALRLRLTPPTSRFSMGEAETDVARRAARVANFILAGCISDQSGR